MLSPSDTLIIFVVVLLLFGPEQLPKIARTLGEFMRNVQNTTHNFMLEMERAAGRADLDAAISALPPAADVSPAESADEWTKNGLAQENAPAEQKNAPAEENL